MVPIWEGKQGEGTSSIVTEGDIDVGGETTGEGEDHVPCGCRRAYSDDHPQIRALDSWAALAINVRARQHRRRRRSPTSSRSPTFRRSRVVRDGRSTWQGSCCPRRCRHLLASSPHSSPSPDHEATAGGGRGKLSTWTLMTTT